MVEIIDGLTFDDVLLEPKRSSIESRKNINTRTKLTKNISINIPIISANMSAVTESAMAITMAKLGGIGIIHRFLSIEEQAKEVSKVKRAESLIVYKPYTISPEDSLAKAVELAQKYNISGFPVVNNEKKLVGLLTNRDIKSEYNLEKRVSEVMTKIESVKRAKANINMDDAEKILLKNKIEKLPLIDDYGILQGLITLKDIEKIRQYPLASKDIKGRLLIGAAIGIRGDYLERAKALVDAGADVLVVDIAHGHLEDCLEAVKKIKHIYDIDVIAGNIATTEGSIDLIKSGADGVKVGLGPGSSCTTRIVTGCGVPQISAIINAYNAAKGYGDIPIIADGGVRSSGDVVKAIAAGASSVMIGNILAATDKSPGEIKQKSSGLYKVFYGMASKKAAILRKEKTDYNLSVEDYVAEGEEGEIPYKGPTEKLIRNLLGGLWSGMSYQGAEKIDDFKGKGKFYKQSQHGIKESYPHDITKLDN